MKAQESHRDRSLEQKIGRIYGLAATVSCLVGIALFCVILTWEYRSRFIGTATTEGEIVARNIEAPLMFDDEQTANTFLASLANNRAIDVAAVYDADGRLFAHYRRQGAAVSVPQASVDTDSQVVRFSHLDLYREIFATDEINRDRRLGTLYIKYNPGGLYRGFLTFTTALCAVFIVSYLIGRIIIRRRQRLITEPIEQLTEATIRITENRNYDIRIPASGTDEIGRLTENFNAMLEQISLRDNELRRNREQLETKVEQRTRELAGYARELEQINEDLRNFVHIFHHDLRTPILNLSCYVDEIEAALASAGSTLKKYERHISEEDLNALRESLGEDTSFGLEIIKSSVSSVKTMLQAIVGLAQISSIRIDIETFEVEPLLREILKDAMAAATPEEDDVRIHGVPARIATDPSVLRQILAHLLDNALKFSGESPRKTVEIFGEETEKEWTLSVRDHGIGISEPEQQRIFDLFRRGDHEAGGQGMGLPYARALAKRIGATLSVESSEGMGSTFRVTVPKPAYEGETVAD